MLHSAYSIFKIKIVTLISIISSSLNDCHHFVFAIGCESGILELNKFSSLKGPNLESRILTSPGNQENIGGPCHWTLLSTHQTSNLMLSWRWFSYFMGLASTKSLASQHLPSKFQQLLFPTLPTPIPAQIVLQGLPASGSTTGRSWVFFYSDLAAASGQFTALLCLFPRKERPNYDKPHSTKPQPLGLAWKFDTHRWGSMVCCCIPLYTCICAYIYMVNKECSSKTTESAVDAGSLKIKCVFFPRLIQQTPSRTSSNNNNNNNNTNTTYNWGRVPAKKRRAQKASRMRFAGWNSPGDSFKPQNWRSSPHKKSWICVSGTWKAKSSLQKWNDLFIFILVRNKNAVGSKRTQSFGTNLTVLGHRWRL